MITKSLPDYESLEWDQIQIQISIEYDWYMGPLVHCIVLPEEKLNLIDMNPMISSSLVVPTNN